MRILKKIKKLIPGLKQDDNPKILAESVSPNCPLLYAVIEEDGNSTYMYLMMREADEMGNPIGACWLRNHSKAPDDWEMDKMEEGRAFMMPKAFCNHPKGKPRLNPEDLRFVWFEEGDGVAILENDEILAVIPYWADENNPTYSKDLSDACEVCFPLEGADELVERIAKADKFWNEINTSPEEFWRKFQDKMVKALEKHFGTKGKYYASEENSWPWNVIAEYEVKDRAYLVSIGASILPQPQIERYYDDPEKHRRIELAISMDSKEFKKNKDAYISYLAGLITYPWDNITHLAHDHSMNLPKPILSGPDHADIETIAFIEGGKDKNLKQLPKFRGDPVNILWIERKREK